MNVEDMSIKDTSIEEKHAEQSSDQDTSAIGTHVEPALLEYHPTTFSQGRMNFRWEELNDETRQQAYDDWQAGRGLIGGNPRQRPNSHLLPAWGIGQPFFRALAMEDMRGENGARLRTLLVSDRPAEVEVGFGRGDFLLDRAKRHPDSLLIGYETKNKATKLMLQRIERFALEKVWVSDDDVRFNLPLIIANGRLRRSIFYFQTLGGGHSTMPNASFRPPLSIYWPPSFTAVVCYISRAMCKSTGSWCAIWSKAMAHLWRMILRWLNVLAPML